MGSFRHPIGPLPSSIYWRRRAVLLGIPLFLVALVAYACTGTSGSPTNNAGPVGNGTPGSSPTPTGMITPAPSETASGPPGNTYPGNPTGTGSGTGNGTGAGSGGSGGSGAAGGTGGGGSGASGAAGSGNGSGQGAGGAVAGCSLSLAIVLDRTSPSGPPQYPSGTYPTFKITATDEGSANCTVDVSGKGMVVSVMPLGTTTPVWTSATCSGAADLRVLGPGDAQTFPVAWKRWQSQADTCPVSKLPTVPTGSYTVNVAAGGVTSSQVEFVLD